MINTSYMRLLRKISKKHNCAGGDKVSDQSVRDYLTLPSIDCLVRKRRLRYAARLCISAPSALTALLQSLPNGKHMPWALLLLNDLNILRNACSRIFEHTPCALESPEFWTKLMTEYPAEWKSTLREYFTVLDDVHAPVLSSTLACLVASFQCSLCPHVPFHNQKALDQHRRVQHGVRNTIREHVGNFSRCPNCCTDFHQRIRLLAHLSDKRRNEQCREFVFALPKIEASELERLDVVDRNLRRVASQAGHTHVLAHVPAS